MLQAQALDILKTGMNVFLTGEPGAGKTHTVNEYVAYLREYGVEVAITAATGIAATHIGGMTIHSWSGIGIREKLNKADLADIATNKYVKRRVVGAKVLIIDEVSMLSVNILDGVEAICRRLRQDSRPFGGLQVVLVGDFFQLPPIFKNELLAQTQATLIDTNGRFAYDSSAWKSANFRTCYLTEQYRQDDADFLELLSAIRRNNFEAKHLPLITVRQIDYKLAPEGITKLFSHNIDVDSVNNSMLTKISAPAHVFRMSGSGRKFLQQTLQKGCLSPEVLCLKVGAVVMFTKNNPREGFANGTLGEVVDFDEESGFPRVQTRDGRTLRAEPMAWVVEENGEITAQITQVPLRLAWAITIHKSQGMSLDAAIMDLRSVFEFGQGYVALSRVRRLSGLYLLGWNDKVFEVHPEVLKQDGFFRADSKITENIPVELSKEEMRAAHGEFMRACGGKNINSQGKLKSKTDKVKAYSVEKIRANHANAYRKWDEAQDKRLVQLFREKVGIKDLAKMFSRNVGAIQSRLKKLGEKE